MTQVTVKDRGFERLKGRLLRRPPTVTVGVHAAEGDKLKEGGEDEGITVAEVAAIHEFGLGVPERSWLRAFVDENESELRKMLSASVKQIASGKLDEEMALSRFGLAVVGMVKKRVTTGIDPELKDETKRRKEKLTGGPKDTPLILYSQLISSIAHELRRRDAESSG